MEKMAKAMKITTVAKTKKGLGPSPTSCPCFLLLQDRQAINPQASICYHMAEDTPELGLGAFKLTRRSKVFCKFGQAEAKDGEDDGGNALVSKQEWVASR